MPFQAFEFQGPPWLGWRITIGTCVVSFMVYYLGWFIYARWFHPLKDIPGPYLGSFSNWWYFRAVRDGLRERSQLPLHKKYGPVVRIAPNDLSIADPDAIDVIYGPKRIFPKTEFYDGFNPHISKRSDSFCETDEGKHAARRRIQAPFYTQAAVLDYEPCVDRVIELFRSRMREFVASQDTVDMATWFRKYTFDVIGEMFYGKEGGFGFLRDNIDYNGWMHMLDVMVAPAASMSYLPKMFRTPYLLSQMVHAKAREGLRSLLKVVEQAKAAANDRLQERATGSGIKRLDILSKLLDLVEEKGEKIDWTIADVQTEIWAIIWAGSDTTAFALTAIFYYLLKNPRSLAKLLEEIDTAFATGALSFPVRFNEAIKLPYLHACVREGMRIHPSVGTMFPRYVPDGGVTISGRFIPAGSRVGINPNVVHFDKEVFGEDSEMFVPERWLRDGERRAAFMERHTLSFGYGPRVCIGKHVSSTTAEFGIRPQILTLSQISTTEMYKLLPTILHEFRFELQTPEWKVCHGWFQSQTDVNVKITHR